MIKIFAVVLLTACASAVFADTAWLVTPDFAFNRRMLLHHCGDGGETAVKWTPSRMRGELSRIVVCGRMALNSRGVLVSAQVVSPHLDREHPGAVQDVGKLVPRIASASPTAAGAVEMIRSTVNKKNFRGGAVFLVADPRQAFAVECSPNRFDVEEVKNGFCVYSHSWRLPALCSVTHLDWDKLWFFRCRETMLARKLSECAESQGVSCPESAVLSRHNEIFGKHNMALGPFSASSRSSVIFESDDEFPETMSAAYIALGSPRHSPHLPVALGVASSFSLSGDSWVKKSERLRAAVGDDPNFKEELLKFEKKLFSDFHEARKTARHRLRRGRNKEAFRILNDTMKKQQRELRSFMDMQLKKHETMREVQR